MFFTFFSSFVVVVLFIIIIISIEAVGNFLIKFLNFLLYISTLAFYGFVWGLFGRGSFLIVACCSVAKLCPTLCDPMDCSLPGSSVHGISQARILEWVALSFSRGSS